jgi:hypothetical protein
MFFLIFTLFTKSSEPNKNSSRKAFNLSSTAFKEVKVCSKLCKPSSKLKLIFII